MKLSVAAFAVAIAGLCAGPIDPEATGSKDPVDAPHDLNPHAVKPPPVQLRRERKAQVLARRLHALDARVAALKDRAERLAIRPGTEPDFERLKALRTNAAEAIEQNEEAALAALNDLETAIELLAATVDQLERVELLPTT